ncbi:Signal transducer [Citrus sinensis]|nr:Signal transducer [Citrus sinensis]
MSQQNINSTNLSYSSNIPVSEVYWSLVEKADKKFSKIRDLPYYERNRYDTYFYKVFKVYTQLWKFQQENREKLVEAGLKRYEIGEIASRIAQLYFGQYMRTSDMSYLSESYIFYEAILTREYFRDGLHQHLNLANKQLRFLARFLMVCLVLNRREMVHQLVNQLKMWLDECKRVFQETDFKEWKLVVQEIVRFLKADTAFMNIRPLRYSLVLDPRPDDLPHVSASVRSLKLRDAILSSYHHNEIKFSELTLDTFRMLQCLEWEPSGSFYQSSNIKTGQNGGPGPSRINYSQDIADPSLPPNPRKAILYRPSVTHFLAAIKGSEKGEPAALLISPSSTIPIAGTDFSRSPSGSSFTIFLTAPLQAFCLLLGILGSENEMDTYTEAEKLLSSSLNDWGSTLATSDNLDLVWAQILRDPFLRRLLLRFLFCRAVLTLYKPTFNKKEFLPECMPSLPDSLLPTSTICRTTVLQMAHIFGATDRFILSEEIILPENRPDDMEKYGGDIDEGYAEGAEQHAGGDKPEEMEKMLQQPGRRYVKNARAILRTPADIYEDPSHYSFILDMPGLEASNIKKKKGQSAENEGAVKAIRIERRRARNMRKFTLPQDSNLEEVKAIYKDGVLTVTVAKKVPEVSRKPKTVTIPVS